jgi:ribosomal protein S18 acetylase RimI-like enzyme
VRAVDLAFRPARPGDADTVVPLMHDASRAAIDATFEFRPGTAAAFLRRDFVRGRGIFGYRHQVVGVTPSGGVVATATVYEGGSYRRLSGHTLLSAVTYFGPGGLAWVARRSAAVAGTIAPPGRGTVYVGNFCVASGYRSRGFGSLLVGHVAALAAERGIGTVELDVAVSNGRAQRLYERLGFTVTGERPGRRADGFDGTRRMTLTIAPRPVGSPEPGLLVRGDGYCP